MGRPRYLGPRRRYAISAFYCSVFLLLIKLLCCYTVFCQKFLRKVKNILNKFSDEKDRSTSVIKEIPYVEKRNRCLGNYWRYVPAVVLLLEKSQPIDSDGKNICSHITVKLNSEGENKSCNLLLNAIGVTSCIEKK